jgi:tetratricopeptide (TPR) repeat protein
MGFRVRKTIKIMPGVRMTVTPRGMSVSAGVKGARVSAHSSGRVTRTLSVPGTGISHVSTSSARGSRPASNNRVPARAATPRPSAPKAPTAPTPGIFAPKWEKELHKHVVVTPSLEDLPRIGAEHEQARPVAALLEATYAALPQGDYARAVGLLRWLFESGYEPANDAFLKKYLPSLAIDLSIAEGIDVQLPPDRNLIGLILAEALQAGGDLAAAADVVEQLEPSTIAAVSLAELYAAQELWDGVVDLTNRISNDDEAATFLLIQRGIALREQGFPDASREALKEALRVRSRPAELRHRALIERGLTYIAEGKRALGRKDFEKVLAEDARYPGLQEHLAQFQD